MVEPIQVWLGVLTLLILVGVPLLIMVGYHTAVEKIDDTIRDIRSHRSETSIGKHLEHRRKVQALKHQRGIPIERLGADIRRLRQSILHSEHCSATQQLALRQAYDTVLSQTCAMLELSHELDRETGGMEREIERVRVEAVLESRGIVITRPRRHDQNA
jgi:hypothetical protein